MHGSIREGRALTSVMMTATPSVSNCGRPALHRKEMCLDPCRHTGDMVCTIIGFLDKTTMLTAAPAICAQGCIVAARCAPADHLQAGGRVILLVAGDFGVLCAPAAGALDDDQVRRQVYAQRQRRR